MDFLVVVTITATYESQGQFTASAASSGAFVAAQASAAVAASAAQASAAQAIVTASAAQASSAIAGAAAGKEVYYVWEGSYTYTKEQAQAKCASLGATLANYGQVVNAMQNGASWCSGGWVSDFNDRGFFPMSELEPNGWCGKVGMNTYWASGNQLLGAHCYGAKPPAGTAGVLPFYKSALDPATKPAQYYSPSIMPYQTASAAVVMRASAATASAKATSASAITSTAATSTSSRFKSHLFSLINNKLTLHNSDHLI